MAFKFSCFSQFQSKMKSNATLLSIVINSYRTIKEDTVNVVYSRLHPLQYILDVFIKTE